MEMTRGARSIAAGAIASLLMAACGSAPTPPAGSPPTPTAAVTSPTADARPTPAGQTTAVTPVPAPSASTAGATRLRVDHDVSYERTSEVLAPGILDVYAPAAEGTWPVVVMLHGTPSDVSKEFLAEHAIRVARLGFVVFDAAWGHQRGAFADLDPLAYATATTSQAACAIAFARARAADYGGDPSALIVFGHSGGAAMGSVAAFGGSRPSEGCLGGSEVGMVDALVTWEGEFMLAPEFDPTLESEPAVFETITPWAYLPRRPDLPVFMLLSEDPGAQVEAPLPAEAVPGYLALRDRDGILTRLVEKTGVFDDGVVSAGDFQLVLYERLRELGNPVTLDIMPGSRHTFLSEDGWRVFLAAFERARTAVLAGH
jgi:acetyl esterase/lipase